MQNLISHMGVDHSQESSGHIGLWLGPVLLSLVIFGVMITTARLLSKQKTGKLNAQAEQISGAEKQVKP